MASQPSPKKDVNELSVDEISEIMQKQYDQRSS